MSVLVLRNVDLDINELRFSDPIPNEYHGKAMYINVEHDGKRHKETLLQTPWMYNPFGLTHSMIDPNADEDQQLKYYVELSFGSAPTEYVKDFHNKMKDMDTYVQEAATTNSSDWLSRPEVSDEYLQEFYKPIVRPYKNKQKEATGEFPDMLRFKVPYYINKDGVSFGNLEVYDASANRIEIHDIEELKTALGRSNRVRCIVKAHSVWQSGTDFGVSWQVVRIQVLANETIGTDCMIIPSDDEEVGNNSDEEEY
jgi:hypothetical protein